MQNNIAVTHIMFEIETHRELRGLNMEVHVTAIYVVAALLPILLFIYRRFVNRVYKLPPGPKGWPVLGTIFSVSPKVAHQDYTRLSRDYGDVTCFSMVGANVVMLNSAEAIREALVSEDTRDAFAGRPINGFYVKYCDHGPSTAYSTFNDFWRVQRALLVKTLKIFDQGQHKIERTIQEELAVVVNMIRDTEGKPFYIKDFAMPSVANILLILVAGKRFDFDDPALRSALEYDDINVRILAGQIINILTWFPFLRHLPFGYGKMYQKYKRCLKNYLHYFFELPKKTFDPSISRGFVDELLRLQRDNSWLTDEKIKGILRETVAAGMGTTRSSLLAFFLIMLHNPHVMRKIQEEIDAVIGRDRSPDLNDRGRMIYTQAATMELLRYVSVPPLGLPHMTTRDVKFRHYFLPKNTLVFANQWAAHHDETVWGDPWEYRPERFLDEKGRMLPLDSEMRKNLVPFGAGRRMCLGETFARTRIFLFVTTLLQKFDFRPCAEEPLPSCDPRTFENGITLQAPKYYMQAFLRQKT